LLAGCGGRSEHLTPVSGYGVGYMGVGEPNEFAYVVVTNIPLQTFTSTLPNGRAYAATFSGNSLELLGETYELDQGKLFCVRAVEEPVVVTQLDHALPKITGYSHEAVAELLATKEVRLCLGL
jgi:hypothetical protein